MKWNAVQTSCETFSYGEVEDYTVTFTTSVPVAPVADFSASATTVAEGAIVNFTDLQQIFQLHGHGLLVVETLQAVQLKTQVFSMMLPEVIQLN